MFVTLKIKSYLTSAQTGSSWIKNKSKNCIIRHEEFVCCFSNKKSLSWLAWLCQFFETSRLTNTRSNLKRNLVLFDCNQLLPDLTVIMKLEERASYTYLPTSCRRESIWQTNVFPINLFELLFLFEGVWARLYTAWVCRSSWREQKVKKGQRLKLNLQVLFFWFCFKKKKMDVEQDAALLPDDRI